VNRAVETCESGPIERALGDALATRATIASKSGDLPGGIAGFQEAFAAYKAVGRQADCAPHNEQT